MEKGSDYGHTSGAVSHEVQLPSTMSGAYRPNQWPQKHHSSHSLKGIGPLMVLPAAGSAQSDAMSFFEQISVRHLNEYHPSESWRNTLMFFSQTVPSVRHAAVALALMHRRRQLDRHSGQSSTDWSPDPNALLHYNRAIRSLVQQMDDPSTDSKSITLLACYLFNCFDHLAGNDVGATNHLRAGVDLLHNIDKTMMLNNDQIYDDSNLSADGMVIRQISRQIRRLDMQAVAYLVNWIPADIQETLTFPIPEDGFHSLDQAADHLYVLVARVMRLHWTEQERPLSSVTPPSSLALKQTVLEQLEQWSSLFDEMLQRDLFRLLDTTAYPQVPLLRLQHTVAWILLSSLGPRKEMEYDNFIPQFQQCVALAKDMVAARERLSESSMEPTLTPEVGIVPVLYIIGVKCRHAAIRREVVSILRRRPMQEAVWHSTWAASVVARIIEIEEGEEGRRMEDIAVWQRVAAVSWIHVKGHPASLDLKYTFCTLEGTHHETLIL